MDPATNKDLLELDRLIEATTLHIERLSALLAATPPHSHALMLTESRRIMAAKLAELQQRRVTLNLTEFERQQALHKPGTTAAPSPNQAPEAAPAGDLRRRIQASPRLVTTGRTDH